MFDNIVKMSITDCYNNLWLALYDEEKHKYITFEESYHKEETKDKDKDETKDEDKKTN